MNKHLFLYIGSAILALGMQSCSDTITESDNDSGVTELDPNTYLPLSEVSYVGSERYSFEEDCTTHIGYNDKGLVAYRSTSTPANIDSLVYTYDSKGRLIRMDDYRSVDMETFLHYNYEEYTYDSQIEDLIVQTVGQENVDQEWRVNKFEFLNIIRDAKGQIAAISNYPPDTEEITVGSYLCEFTYDNGKLVSFTKQVFQPDPMGEEVRLTTSQKWDNIEWEDYSGNVTDPSNCFMGKNRIKAARVYDADLNQEYTISVTYGGSDARNFKITHDYATDVPCREEQVLTFLDGNGSFKEESLKYNRNATTQQPELYYVRCISETYDTHHNLILKEDSHTDDLSNPTVVSPRMGTKYEYTYDETYNDWTRRDYYIYEQFDKRYEKRGYIVRDKWDTFGNIKSAK